MNINYKYCNMNCSNRPNTAYPQRQGTCGGYQGANTPCNNSLARKIQEIDFAIYETVLYLDAYPYNTEALEYYHSLIHQRDLMVAEYEKNHSPMTAFGNQSHTSWDWISSPWPWEISAN